MKSVIFYFSFFLIMSMSTVINAQIDSRKKSIVIPAIESPKDSLNSSGISPIKPDNEFNSGVLLPKTLPELNLPKKEFSMFPTEEFANPGELYMKRLEKVMLKVNLILIICLEFL